jgi:hypothetical protein
LKSRLEEAHYWSSPGLRTTRFLADIASTDEDFLAVAELLRGHPGFEIHTLVKELVEVESVPFLPVLRYTESGRRKRDVWEQTWELQRAEDLIETIVQRQTLPLSGESKANYYGRVAGEAKKRKRDQVRDIPRPPKYKAADFLNTTWWRLRGGLDVPKERFISYPFLSKENDQSLLVGWAGWNHLEQAQALAAWLNDVTEYEGWTTERLIPLLAGLAELIPWLKQWHNQPNPEYGPLGDFFETYLAGQLHQHGLTSKDLAAWTPPAVTRGRKKK